MDSIIGHNCPFSNDNNHNKIADGLINYILFHNEIIRKRSEQRSYVQGYFGDFKYDPFPDNEYVTFEDRINPPLDEKKKPIKIDKTKKFISVNSNIKKWLGFICSRVAFEADAVFNELAYKLNSGSTNTADLDNIMFNKSFEFNLFKLIANCVGNNEFMLKKFMNIQLLETEISNKIKERYDLSYPLRQYNKNIADWLGKLLDDFFKLLAVHISLKNWFDRDATINEKNLPSILWLLAENTNYSESLYDFMSYIVPNTMNEKTETSTDDIIDFDFSKLSVVVKNNNVEPIKKTRGKKAEPNKILSTQQQPILQIEQPPFLFMPTQF